MNKRFHSSIVLWMLGIIVLVLAGCGREAQQRQAFIGFLQKEVIPRNSGILAPTKAMRKKFGDYAAHYDVIVDFNKLMLEKLNRPLDKMQREFSEAMKPEASVEERREATIKYRAELQKIEATLNDEFAATEAKIIGLRQPEDLKIVYTLAVDKHVRIPARALKIMIPATREMLSKNVALLDFIKANKGKVEIKDGMIQVRDQSTLAKLNEMQADISKMAQAIQKQHNEFTSQISGK